MIDTDSVKCLPKTEIKVVSKTFNNALNRIEIVFDNKLKNRDFNKELSDSSLKF
jgi:hypothetical protein